VSRVRLSSVFADIDTRPLTALRNAVASAKAEESCAMVDGSIWWDVDNALNSRREWAWALVYFLEWVKRGER
jgi:hypothetical protein